MRAGLLATLTALAHGGRYVEPAEWLTPEEVAESPEASLEAFERSVMQWVAGVGGTLQGPAKPA